MNAERLERRSVEIGFRAQLEERVLHGYAAVFDTETPIGGKAGFVERIRRGAFKRSLASGRDILGLKDHDPAAVLGRTKSRTLTLREDAHGLEFELSVPATTLGNDLLTMARRGDLGGVSFGFRVEEAGQRWQGRLRELIDVDLLEISIISSFPAYAQTVVNARAAEAWGAPSRLIFARRWLDTAGGADGLP